MILPTSSTLSKKRRVILHQLQLVNDTHTVYSCFVRLSPLWGLIITQIVSDRRRFVYLKRPWWYCFVHMPISVPCGAIPLPICRCQDNFILDVCFLIGFCFSPFAGGIIMYDVYTACMYIYICIYIFFTLPETDIATENQSLEDEISSGPGLFEGAFAVGFRKCMKQNQHTCRHEQFVGVFQLLCVQLPQETPCDAEVCHCLLGFICRSTWNFEIWDTIWGLRSFQFPSFARTLHKGI